MHLYSFVIRICYNNNQLTNSMQNSSSCKTDFHAKFRNPPIVRKPKLSSPCSQSSSPLNPVVNHTNLIRNLAHCSSKLHCYTSVNLLHFSTSQKWPSSTIKCELHLHSTCLSLSVILADKQLISRKANIIYTHERHVACIVPHNVPRSRPSGLSRTTVYF